MSFAHFKRGKADGGRFRHLTYIRRWMYYCLAVFISLGNGNLAVASAAALSLKSSKTIAVVGCDKIPTIS